MMVMAALLAVAAMVTEPFVSDSRTPLRGSHRRQDAVGCALPVLDRGGNLI